MALNQEENGEDTVVVGVSEDLVQFPDHKSAGTTELTFGGLLRTPLRLHEDLRNGCGGQLWPAGMVLGKYLLQESKLETLCGKEILELGAGGGLVGLAVALAIRERQSSNSSDLTSSTSISITDQDAMHALMQRNIQLNNLPSTLITCEVLDWGALEQVRKVPDVLLAADCVYFEPAFPLLLQTMEALIGAETVCYFCFKRRRRADLQFIKEARKLFSVENVTDDPDRDVWSKQRLFLYKITKK